MLTLGSERQQLVMRIYTPALLHLATGRFLGSRYVKLVGAPGHVA
jgi:hypothetical protein